ncbi:DUF4123 domain-containing protein [Billgrantia desiderata]|uniref:DUF4123 domain-containing protein n=1 Tax=Billgrantia desiderata TaxID=52021 RepID=UPI001F45F6A6|nr:DUF4123 domain-containing protein [Halomonas desiderata]MCE8014037.1 DUF4123 domain-containing protein [Halomonas desiderata]
MSLRPVSQAQVFYLTDQALYPQAQQRMFEADDSPTYQLLYLQTPYRQHAAQGPLLLMPSTPRAGAVLERWVEQGVAIGIHSHHSFSTLVEHWRSLTQVRRQEGPAALFRYADPRLYAGLETALSPHEIARLLGPVHLMYGLAAGKTWRLESPDSQLSFSSEEFVLTTAHQCALEAWREGVFSSRLAEEYGVPEACVLVWLEQMKALALPTEHAQWEGCRVLAEAGRRTPLSARQMERLGHHAYPWQQRLAQLRVLATTAHEPDEAIS